MVVNFCVLVVVKWLLVVIFGVLALVMDARDVMVTSPPELTHLGGKGGGGEHPNTHIC